MSYFGIPIRNGLPIGLGSVAPLASGGGSPFSPLSLFSGGTPGAWYDPSDYSTLFQDSAGTTPVTAVEQPVGLMLDKSQGLVLGSELVTNGTFDSDTAWTKAAGVTISGGAANFSAVTNSSALYQAAAVVIGKTYKITVTATVVSGDVNVRLFGGTTGRNITASGSYSFYDSPTIANPNIGCASVAFTGSIDNISVKELAGNHAFQATSASRPVLSARYNLLTNSFFANTGGAAPTGYTQSFGTGTSAPSGTAANGDIIYTQTATAQRPLISQAVTTVVGVVYTSSMTVSAASGLTVADVIGASGVVSTYTLNGASVLGTVLASPGVVTATWTAAATTSGARFGIGVIGNATGSISFHSAQLIVTNSLTSNTYQRVNTATDYATTGFLPYLKFDGVDDSLSTNSISFTSTDKMSVFAGVRKLSDAALAMLFETSTNAGNSNGAVYFLAPSANGQGTYQIQSKGTLPGVTATTANSYPAPITNVLTGISNIAAPSLVLRANGTQVASDTTSQGTGNYGNYPLFIGRRNNASLPFNGQLYSMVIVGKAVTAGELSSTEAYVNLKTGAY